MLGWMEHIFSKQFEQVVVENSFEELGRNIQESYRSII